VWDTLLRSIALLSQTWVLYANRVGFEDGVAFGGGTLAIDPFGEPAGQIAGLATGSLAVRITRAALLRARVQTPLRRDEKPWLLAEALRRGAR
jgi:predicted amidohydrolase